MAIEHKSYLYGIRVEGIFYPLSYEVFGYKSAIDKGEYIQYFIQFNNIEKEYIENIHTIRQSIKSRSLEITLEGYDKEYDIFFNHIKGILEVDYVYSMDVWGSLSIKLIISTYKRGRLL